MGYVLKLAERWVGERMLVACLYKRLPCGHTGSSECKECGIKTLDYEEHMLGVPRERHMENYVRPPIPWDEPRPTELPPLNETQQKELERIRLMYARYQGDSLTVGGKEYPIYDSNKDFMPCGAAPEIELTDEEVAAWRGEFQGRTPEGAWCSDSLWVPFDDELFLK